MTTPRFWTDPLNGVDYATRSRLLSTQMNNYRAGLLNLDYALEWNQASTYTLATASSARYSRVHFDRKYRQVIALGEVTGSTSVSLSVYSLNLSYQGTRSVSGEPAGGWTTAAGAIASDDNGTVVVGATTVNDSVKKVASSSDGGAFTAQSLNTGGAGVGVKCAIWDPYHDVFIVGINGSTTATTIETSPTGTTWTARTNANTNAPSAIATDGAGTVVIVSSASTNKAVRSTDLVNWAEVTLPATATWDAVTYSKGLGKFFASDDNSNLISSSNGITWSSVSFSDPPTLVGRTPCVLGSTKNIVFGQNTGGGIWISDDGALFTQATIVNSGVGAAANRHMHVTDEVALAVMNDGTDSYFAASSYFRI